MIPRSVAQALLAGLMLVAGAGANRASNSGGQGTPAWSDTVSLRHAASCGAFSPDGQTFASGGLEDGRILLWQVSGGKQLHALHQQPGWVESLAFSPDGKILESRTRYTKRETDATIIRLWDVSTGKEVFKLIAPKVKPGLAADWVVAFSPDRKTLALSRGQKTVHLLDVGTGKELRRLAGHQAPIRSLLFSAHGKTLASQAGDQTVHLWEVATGKELRRRQWQGQEVANVAFTVGGMLLVTTYAADDRGRLAARLWDVAAIRAELEAPLALSGTFSPDGKFLAAWTGLGPCLGGALILWDVSTTKAESLLTGQIQTAGLSVFSPDGKVLAAVWGPPSMDAMAELWEVRIAKRLIKIGLPGGINSLAFSPDGKLLALAGVKQCILQRLVPLRGFGGSVSALTLSPDGRLLATGTVDGAIGLWDAATGKQLRKFLGHSKAIHAVTFSPYASMLASGGEDGTVRLWQVGTGQLDQTLNVGRGEIRAIGFSDGTRTLMVDSPAGSRRWDVITGKEIH